MPKGEDFCEFDEFSIFIFSSEISVQLHVFLESVDMHCKKVVKTLRHEGERALRPIVHCLFQYRELQIFKCCDELSKLNLKSECCLLLYFLENFVEKMMNLAIRTSFF